MQKQAASYLHIRENPRFKALVRKRNRFAYWLCALLVTAYFSYILLIAFRPDWLAQGLVDGMTMNFGLLLGLAVMALTVLLTAIYVRRANDEFDRETTEIRRQALK